MSSAVPILAAPFTGGMSLIPGALTAANRLATAPSPSATPPPVATDTPAVQQAQAMTAKRRVGAMGYRSTLLASLTPNVPAKTTMGS